MNLAAIDAVATALEALASGVPTHPELCFYMPSWAKRVDALDEEFRSAWNLPPECGTAACLGGWTVYLLAPDGPTLVADASVRNDGDDWLESDDLHALAIELLGLSREAATELFGPWVGLDTRAEHVAVDRATPAQGARVLRLVAAGTPPLDAWRTVLGVSTGSPDDDL